MVMLVEESAVDFLTVILPRAERMRESSEVLVHSNERSQHLDAAYDLLDGLCQSIRMFSSVSLPRLLGSDDPMPVDKYQDLAWLEDTGYHLDEVLHSHGLIWPPPEQRVPPAIVPDLREMYDQLAYRHMYLDPITSESLLRVVNPVGELACNLMDAVGELLQALERTGSTTTFARIVKKIGFALAALATTIVLMQGPSTINEFGPAWTQFSQSVENVAKIAAQNVVDLGTEMYEGVTGESLN
jgi:hypothetical protein